MGNLKDLFWISWSASFIYFPTQYDANFPNPFLRIFNIAENLHVISNHGARETRKKHDVCQTCAIILILLIMYFYNLINQYFMLLVETSTNTIVCHENNLKQLEFWFFGKHVFFILCGFVCFRKCYFLIKHEAIFFFKISIESSLWSTILSV